MKKLLLILAIFNLQFSLFNSVAQAPLAIPYQAVARDNAGNPIASQAVSLRFTIHDATAGGTIVYQETQSKTTNALGLFTANIGEGTVVSGTFATIEWGGGSKFMQVEMDATGGTAYTDMGTQQMLSVPYALNAGNGNFNKAGNDIYNSNSGNVGIGTTTPVSSAKLDVSSTTQGFLPPRMTGTQRDAIVSPTAGLIVWCTNCGTNGGELQAYNGSSWRNMSGGAASNPPLVIDIGMNYQGGILAYILQPGDPGYDANVPHGLIAAPGDQLQAQWGCYGSSLSGADGTGLGTGNQNTIDIMNGCPTAGIAARICGDLVLGGYSDWFLPSRDELHKLYLNIGQGAPAPNTNVGGFASDYYWSSTEVNDGSGGYAWLEYFYNGYQGYNSKTNTFRVRAVRAF